MAGLGDNPEIDGGLGKVQEVTKEQAEQFQEQMRAAQAALQALQKQEEKAKKRDGSLAGLLSKFVKSNKDMDILQLIVFCLNMNIPVNFIVAVLSLFYFDIYKELALQFKKEDLASLEQKEKEFLDTLERQETTALENPQEFHEQHLPAHVKARINEWVKDIMLLCLEEMRRVLDTVYENQKAHLTPTQLSTKVLEKYLNFVKIQGEYERVKAFSEFILNGIGQQIRKEWSSRQVQEKNTADPIQ